MDIQVINQSLENSGSLLIFLQRVHQGDAKISGLGGCLPMIMAMVKEL
ncbi:hypothetical protein HF675_15425 [Serratia sp. JUb9]|nr:MULTISPECIES: hypothetical protein [unclassified Serratia (in: enterobacteria)]MCA4823085.1 hypothetical protein [Serratia rubidaea]QNK31023.1 hypothetical protein HF675_15425 [Serratia sp. JUb9]QPT15063.1 hypothetical protein I6G37_08985 [Serratia rubidaea]